MALVLVTGTSSGLGTAAAHELERAGHQVVVHARETFRAPVARSLGWAGVLAGDFTDAEEIRRVAREADELGPFDAVIHNAGALHPPEALPVNVIAPYLLTALMAPPARLIVLSSEMHHGGSTDLGRLAAGTATYSDTKLWVTTFSAALALRWPETASHAVDPGWVPTRMGGPGARDDLADGHRTQVWLATAPEVTPRTGAFWRHLRTEQAHPAVDDPGFQSELLAALAAVTGVPLPDGAAATA